MWQTINYWSIISIFFFDIVGAIKESNVIEIHQVMTSQYATVLTAIQYSHDPHHAVHHSKKDNWAQWLHVWTNEPEGFLCEDCMMDLKFYSSPLGTNAVSALNLCINKSIPCTVEDSWKWHIINQKHCHARMTFTTFHQHACTWMNWVPSSSCSEYNIIASNQNCL